MNKRFRKIRLGGLAFYYSAKKQLLREDTILISAATGLYQGLKYGGNFKRGIKSGLATLVTVSAINGLLNVVDLKEKINQLVEEDKDILIKKSK